MRSTTLDTISALVGTTVPFNGAEDPALSEKRLLLEEGQGIDRTLDEYKALDAAVYVGDADNDTADSFYHADNDDGTSRNTAGQYLILPDRRGLAMRGAGTNASQSDAAGSNYAGPSVGSYQADQMQQITGAVGDSNDASFGLDNNGAAGSGAIDVATSNNSGRNGGGAGNSFATLAFDSANSPNARTGTETRMASSGARWAIIY